MAGTFVSNMNDMTQQYLAREDKPPGESGNNDYKKVFFNSLNSGLSSDYGGYSVGSHNQNGGSYKFSNTPLSPFGNSLSIHSLNDNFSNSMTLGSPNLQSSNYFNDLNPRSPSLQSTLNRSPQSPFVSSPLINPSLSRGSTDFFMPLSLGSSYTSDSNGTFSSFNLPTELQGGITKINSRRPSYAAETMNHNNSYIDENNYSAGYIDSFNLSPPNTAPLNGPRSAAGSPKLQFTNQPPYSATASSFSIIPESPFNKSFKPSNSPVNYNSNNSAGVNLDNGLLLVNNHIVTSPELRNIYKKANKYFCVDAAEKVYTNIKALLDPMSSYSGRILNLVGFLKKRSDISNSNNTKFKSLCLVCSKAGKIDVLTVSSNSNILLQKHDLVIVDGDRGKDLMHIIEPTIGLNFVVLLNFLKKREHLKSMGGASPNNKNKEDIYLQNNPNYIQDDENVVSLPSKQILRFASSQDVSNLPSKLKNEIIAFKIAIEKLNQLNLKNAPTGRKYDQGPKSQLDLKIFNAEFQFDKKKLIFYYSCDKRNDFRDLIKELFKVYKTRIWLCAVLNPDDFSPYNESNIASRKNLESSLREYCQTDCPSSRKSSVSSISLSSSQGLDDNVPTLTPNSPVHDSKKALNGQSKDHILKSKYHGRINKILSLDENNFKFDEVAVDEYHAQNLLNSIENLRIDLNIN